MIRLEIKVLEFLIGDFLILISFFGHFLAHCESFILDIYHCFILGSEGHVVLRERH